MIDTAHHNNIMLGCMNSRTNGPSSENLNFSHCWMFMVFVLTVQGFQCGTSDSARAHRHAPMVTFESDSNLCY